MHIGTQKSMFDLAFNPHPGVLDQASPHGPKGCCFTSIWNDKLPDRLPGPDMRSSDISSQRSQWPNPINPSKRFAAHGRESVDSWIEAYIPST